MNTELPFQDFISMRIQDLLIVLVLAGIKLIFFIVTSMGYVLDLCWKQC